MTLSSLVVKKGGADFNEWSPKAVSLVSSNSTFDTLNGRAGGGGGGGRFGLGAGLKYTKLYAEGSSSSLEKILRLA